MPGTDTSDLPVTSVRFLLQMSGSESFHDTSETFTLGDTNDVDQFVLAEHLVDSDFLFEVLVGESDFLSNIFSTVDLDFEDIVLLLTEVSHQLHLGVSNDSDRSTVLFDSVELGLHSLRVLGVLRLIVGESFSLGVHPVLVESSKSSLVEMLSPDS